MFSDIKYSEISEPIKDNNAFPIVEVVYLKKRSNVAVAEQYGVHGSAPIGTPCLMFTVNKDEANRMVIPLSALTRTKNLKETEFECGNFVVGSKILFDAEGNITITSKEDINIKACGGDINITGDVHIIGALDVSGDVVAAKGTTDISLITHVHTGVTTGGSNTGTPV